MLSNYLPVLIFLVVATGLAVVLLGLGTLFGRLGSTRPRDAPPACCVYSALRRPSLAPADGDTNRCCTTGA